MTSKSSAAYQRSIPCPTASTRSVWRTLADNVLDTSILLASFLLRLCVFILLSQFRQDFRADLFNDAREDRIARGQEPWCVGRLVEIDANFEHGVLGDAQVSAYG